MNVWDDTLMPTAEDIENAVGKHKVDAIAAHMRPILEGIGMDLSDPSTKDTPERFAKYLLEFSNSPDIEEILGNGFEHEGTAMVIQSGIPFRMICEHHLLPAWGKASIGLVPNGRVVGLSKYTRLVQAAGTAEPSLQEHICDRLADILMERIQPKGVMVVLEAEHGCMSCRGVNVTGVITTTSAVRGCFFDNAEARTEFLSLAITANKR